MQTENNHPVEFAQPEPEAGELLAVVIEADIRRLKTFSNRGLWALSLFLLISLMAWRDFPLLPLPDTIIASLGAPPSPQVISTVLLLYTFSAIILSLSRMMAAMEHKSSFCHVGYLTGFFLFYHFAKALNDNYWAVLGAGFTILSVESYRIWSYCNEFIKKKTEQLEYVRRTGRMPLEE
ncbi:hypothetical protein GSbR_40330 [Geobacter sp. SVR]|nr:hypothetical protein GSVR_27060 [Geobacter sp. SVR]GCF87433.1 hypothetical protein GSbR_40330 [Geobacter sp. SVR]